MSTMQEIRYLKRIMMLLMMPLPKPNHEYRIKINDISRFAEDISLSITKPPNKNYTADVVTLIDT